MSKDEVLKLALEVLVSSTGELHRHLASHNDYQLVKNHRVIQSIKAALEAKDEPVATDWERIARVQNAKLMAVCDEAGGFEKLREVMDKYEALSPTPPQQEAKDERVQVSPLQFVEMVMEKEDCVGKPIIWAEWPNKENT